MKYEVLMTAQAAADLRAVFEYIAYDLLAGQNALDQLDRLEQAILSLDEMPERFRLCDKEPWKERNLRIMPVDHYLGFTSRIGKKSGSRSSASCTVAATWTRS